MVITACVSIFVIGFMLGDIKTTPQPMRSIQIGRSLSAIISRQICQIVLEQELVSFLFYDKYEINMNKI